MEKREKYDEYQGLLGYGYKEKGKRLRETKEFMEEGENTRTEKLRMFWKLILIFVFILYNIPYRIMEIKGMLKFLFLFSEFALFLYFSINMFIDNWYQELLQIQQVAVELLFAQKKKKCP